MPLTTRPPCRAAAVVLVLPDRTVCVTRSAQHGSSADEDFDLVMPEHTLLQHSSKLLPLKEGQELGLPLGKAVAAAAAGAVGGHHEQHQQRQEEEDEDDITVIKRRAQVGAAGDGGSAAWWVSSRQATPVNAPRIRRHCSVGAEPSC